MTASPTSHPSKQDRVAIPDAVRRAVELHEAGRLNDAERIYRAVLEAVPQHFQALQMLGVLCVQTGHPGEGAALLHRAVEADPASGVAHANLANVLKQLGRFDEALLHCDRALALDAGNAGVHASVRGCCWTSSATTTRSQAATPRLPSLRARPKRCTTGVSRCRRRAGSTRPSPATTPRWP